MTGTVHRSRRHRLRPVAAWAGLAAAYAARRVDQGAAALAVPEVAWTAFATVLSTAVAARNTGAKAP